jgi:hypothetical protein
MAGFNYFPIGGATIAKVKTGYTKCQQPLRSADNPFKTADNPIILIQFIIFFPF